MKLDTARPLGHAPFRVTALNILKTLKASCLEYTVSTVFLNHLFGSNCVYGIPILQNAKLCYT